MEAKETDDIDILRQMYATIFGGADEALSLLEEGNVWQARDYLQRAMSAAEEIYIAGQAAGDEFTARRAQRDGFADDFS